MASKSRSKLRLSFLVERAKAANLPRVWRMATHIGKKFRKPRAGVFLDMVYSAVRYECAFQDYQDWDFAMLSPRERRSFITHPISDHYARRFNTDRAANKKLSNKLTFNKEFASFTRRAWLDLRDATDDELHDFLEANPVIMAKVPDSLGGDGIAKIDSSRYGSIKEFRAERVRSRQLLLEEFISQHEELNRLNASSVNTMRIVSFNRGGHVSIICAALRIGAGGDVDNFSGGGMYTMLNHDGVVEHPAFDGEDRIHAIHPISGVPIVGFQVPQFNEAIELVNKAAGTIPEVPYVGWDIAISDKGPVIIEGNYNTGVFQLKPSVSDVRQGLRQRYREVIGE